MLPHQQNVTRFSFKSGMGAKWGKATIALDESAAYIDQQAEDFSEKSEWVLSFNNF